MSSRIEADEVRRIARLAHLALTDAETAKMTEELDKILDYVALLSEANVEAVVPTTGMDREPAALRADEPTASLPACRATGGAPVTVEGGFAVPAFVDEG